MKYSMNFKKGKRIFLATFMMLCLVGGTNIVRASEPAFDKGSNTIGLALGFGGNLDYYGSPSLAPAFTVIFDHGTFPEVGPGTIGIGGIIGYKSASLDYAGGFKTKWTNFLFAARGSYHLTILKDKNNKFDPYAGVTLGFRINSYSDTYNDYFYSNYGYYYNTYNNNNFNIVAGVFVGAKYNFTENFGVFGELGYDISIARIGINFNF